LTHTVIIGSKAGPTCVVLGCMLAVGIQKVFMGMKIHLYFIFIWVLCELYKRS